MANINYPYLPKGQTIQYVDATDRYMMLAREVARKLSLDKLMPTGTLVVKDRKVIGSGANGSDYHNSHGCERIRLGSKTGEDYDRCEGCHPKNHSEAKAIKDVKSRRHNTQGANLYLWGHWWCCRWCWDAIIKAGIANIFLVKGSEILFNKECPENIVGKQFR